MKTKMPVPMTEPMLVTFWEFIWLGRIVTTSAPVSRRSRLAPEAFEPDRWLEDGDEVIMRGYCEREGFRRIGLGECRGRVLPAD